MSVATGKSMTGGKSRDMTKVVIYPKLVIETFLK